jgi:RND family efflux transporter MFP subunit
VAPIDGRVTALDASLGQVVAGTEDLVTIANLAVVWADLRIYERDLSRVAQGAPVELAAASYPGRTFRGGLTFVGDVVDPATRTVQARARLENPDGALRPGMTATALLRLAEGPPAVLLPSDAVQTIEGSRVVFVRVSPDRFAPRPVALGPEQNGRVPVLWGVLPGDDVVVHGALALHGAHDRAELEGQ